jgi:signal transduction histidine kinase
LTPADAGLVILLVGGATWWLLGASLRPVVRMTRQAAAWSEQDLDHRFALGPPHDEPTELAATLDGLLDRLAASLRRERRFSAELLHELRTPLFHVLAETELALSRERHPTE